MPHNSQQCGTGKLVSFPWQVHMSPNFTWYIVCAFTAIPMGHVFDCLNLQHYTCGPFGPHILFCHTVSSEPLVWPYNDVKKVQWHQFCRARGANADHWSHMSDSSISGQTFVPCWMLPEYIWYDWNSFWNLYRLNRRSLPICVIYGQEMAL